MGARRYLKEATMELPNDRSALPAEHAGTPVPEPATPESTAAAPAADGLDANPDPLTVALDRLVDRGLLDRSQAGAVLVELGRPPHPPRPGGLRRLLGEIAGYLGASFVVGATLIFLGQEWDSLGQAGRFSTLAAMAAILFGTGLAVRQRAAPAGDNVRRRLASTLLTGAAAAAGFAAYVGLEYAAVPGGRLPGDTAGFVSSVVGLAVAIVGYLLARSALGQLAVAVAAFAVYADLLNLLTVEGTEAVGLGMLALGALWAVLAWRRLVAEHLFAIAIAVTFGLIGAQTVAIRGNESGNLLGYALTALVAGICFTAYTRIRDWVVLAGGVIGATLVVPEFLNDVTDGSLGASGVMLVAGVTLLAGSLVGLRMRRDAQPGPTQPGPTQPGPTQPGPTQPAPTAT
jgi:predicted membrane protein DUF2157